MLARSRNDGFAAGVNAGWRVAQGRWLLILNPDVDVAQGFLSHVLERLARFESDRDRPPGIVGFGLRNPDGSPQGSVGIFPSLARTIWEQFIPRSRRKYQAGSRIPAGPVDWVTGACMLVNSEMIQGVGGMDEDFFLYYEEVAFSHSAHRLGWKVAFDPGLEVIHRYPLQNRPISPKMRVITRHSKLLYFRKHLPRWQFRALSAIVAFEATIRGFWSRLRARPEEVRSWQAIGDLVGRFRCGNQPRGRDVLEFAESAVRSETGSPPNPVCAPAGDVRFEGSSGKSNPAALTRS
jgi:N-acetylglucosaminyl-diphospho-decaprenol L-rhamnosyltransferase